MDPFSDYILFHLAFDVMTDAHHARGGHTLSRGTQTNFLDQFSLEMGTYGSENKLPGNHGLTAMKTGATEEHWRNMDFLSLATVFDLRNFMSDRLSLLADLFKASEATRLLYYHLMRDDWVARWGLLYPSMKMVFLLLANPSLPPLFQMGSIGLNLLETVSARRIQSSYMHTVELWAG